jgi:hypothetical protein
LDGFSGIFGCEPSHKQCQLAVECHFDGSPINPLHVFRSVSAATIYFHNKFRVLHEFSSRSGGQAKWRRESRLPSLSLNYWWFLRSFADALGLFAFEGLLAADVYLDLLRLGFGFLRQLDPQAI